MTDRYDRRTFLERLSITSAGALGAGALLPGLACAAEKQAEVPEGTVVLFQGDSITDAGRDRENDNANSSGALGRGYAFLASARLRAEHAAAGLQCYNRGISGNKVYQLADRWQEDCLDLQPDLLSILIGVNDYWHTLSGNYDGTAEVYERDYRALLDRTMQELPDLKLIIAEPFVVTEGSAVDAQEWIPAFDAYREIARNMASEFGAELIPYQEIFDNASAGVPPTYWTGDGVHPTMAGSQLMADAWLQAFERAI